MPASQRSTEGTPPSWNGSSFKSPRPATPSLAPTWPRKTCQAPSRGGTNSLPSAWPGSGRVTRSPLTCVRLSKPSGDSRSFRIGGGHGDRDGDGGGHGDRDGGG